MLFFALLATIAFAQKKTTKENKQCLSTALGGALQKGFEACDLQTQLELLDAQLAACGAGKGFTVVVRNRGQYYPYSGNDKGSAFADVMAKSKKFFSVEDQDFFFSFKAPSTLVPTADNKNFEVFNDKDFEAAIDFSRAYHFPLILNYEIIHDFRDAQIHQVVGPSSVTLSTVQENTVPGRTFKFKKLQADTRMKFTYVDVGQVRGNNFMCNWEVRINGKSCPSGAISGSLSTGPGSDNDHTSIFVSGFCDDLPVGEHTMSIFVSRTSTAATCTTGWQKPELRNQNPRDEGAHYLLEAEELLPGYQNLQILQGAKYNTRNGGWVVDGTRRMDFEKLYDDSWVRIVWVDNFRRWAQGWCRFELKVDNGNCPGHGIAAHFHGHNPDNEGKPKQLVGYCKKNKGKHTLRVHINRHGASCALGYGKIGGADNYYMEVRELGITGERLTWVQRYNQQDGRDIGYVNYRYLDFVKLDDDTEMRFLWNDNARVYGNGNKACTWEIRVDSKPCVTGRLAFSQFAVGNDNDYQTHSLLGYCGNIKKGKHRMQIYVTYQAGGHDCLTGGYWSTPNNYILEAEEADPKRSD